MNLKEQRTSKLASAQKILDGAKASGRGITDTEQTTVEGLFDEIKAIDIRIKAAAGSDALMSRIEGMGSSGVQGFDGETKGWAGAVLEASGSPLGAKALVSPAGSVTVATPEPLIVPQGAPAANIASLLKFQAVAGNYSFLQQTTRTDSAAFVAEGALKPTSLYTVTRMDGKLQVLAHLSEALPRFMFEDSANLQRFLTSEMQRGLVAELDDQILTGDGTAPNLTGILGTSGIQTQAFVTDALTTTRTAVAKLENLSITPTAWVLNPTDWQAIELAQVSTGSMFYAYQAGGSQQPAQQAQRMLWGTPVLVSSTIAAGTGLLGDFSGAAMLYTDGAGVRLDWSENVSDDFSKNQLRWRCEARYGLGVLQPMGFVKVTLTGA